MILKTAHFRGKALAFIACLALTFTACNFTEDIYINSDGTGSVSLSFDASEMMAMAGALNDTVEQTKAMDSVMYFSDILDEKKDSIAQLSAEEQERLEKLRPYRMHIKADPETEEMTLSFGRDFDDISVLGDTFETFQDASALENTPGTGGSPPTPEIRGTSEMDFSFKKGVFTRQTTITDPERHKMKADSLAESASFLSGSTYTLKIHFPSRVKSTTASEATLSIDGKTLIRQVDLVDYLKDPKILDLEVVLED